MLVSNIKESLYSHILNNDCREYPKRHPHVGPIVWWNLKSLSLSSHQEIKGTFNFCCSSSWKGSTCETKVQMWERYIDRFLESGMDVTGWWYCFETEFIAQSSGNQWLCPGIQGLSVLYIAICALYFAFYQHCADTGQLQVWLLTRSVGSSIGVPMWCLSAVHSFRFLLSRHTVKIFVPIPVVSHTPLDFRLLCGLLHNAVSVWAIYSVDW